MVFPFGVGDPRDDIDRVARELTGNQFRLKRDDPDAGQKFLNFVAESEGQFMQVQRAQGAVSPTDPRGIQAPPAPAPVAGQPQAAQPFETGGFQRAPQPEPSYGPINPEFVRQLGDQRGSFGDFVTTPIIDREVAEDAARNVARFMPLLGEGVAANIGGAASEITTLPDLAIGSLTAGFGAPIAGAASRIPFAGRVLRPLLEPISGSPGRALAAEAAAGTGAVFGAERTAEALEDTDIPAPLKTALTLGGGLAAGVGAVTTPSVARRLGRTALEAGEQAAEAIGRTGVGNVLDPVPARRVAARAAGGVEEPTFFGRASGDFTKRTRRERIQAIFRGEVRNPPEDLEIFADRVFHETGGRNALGIIGGGDNTPLDTFVSNVEELATGQGQNKGVLFELSPEGIQATVNKQKPGLAMVAEESGAAEFVIPLRSHSSLRDNVVSFTIDPSVQSREIRVLLNALAEPNELGQGHLGGRLKGLYDRETLPDGRIRFTPKQAETPPQTVAARVGGTVDPEDAARAADDVPSIPPDDVIRGDATRREIPQRDFDERFAGLGMLGRVPAGSDFEFQKAKVAEILQKPLGTLTPNEITRIGQVAANPAVSPQINASLGIRQTQETAIQGSRGRAFTLEELENSFPTPQRGVFDRQGTTIRDLADASGSLAEDVVDVAFTRVGGTVDPEDAIEAEVARIRQQRQIPQTVEEAIDAPDVPEVISRSTELPRSELSASEQLFGLSGRVDTGLTRAERLANRARQTISGSNISDIQGISRTLGAEADPIIEPIFRERKRVIQNAEQLANSVTSRVSPQVRRAFDISDNGIINSLAGIDPDLPVAPTIQDVAARLPRFLSSLTPEQRAVMEQLRKIAEPYGRALRESGDDFGTRTDIMEGGFYLPRGNAANGDLAIGVARGSRRPGASIGQEQSARFNSMAEGLAGGWEYDTFDNALRGLITRSGQRVADNFTQNTLRQARDEGGQKLGLTIKELLVRDNPVVAGQFDTLRASALKLKNLLKNKDSQAIRNLERLLADPEFDDVAEVRRVFFNSRQILRGELKGQNVAQVREALSDLQRELAEFRPIYEQAKKSAARNAGRRAIGGAEAFPQLNGVTFPERMAARANEILAQEQARVPKTIEAIDAIQRVWKAGNATLDNSGIGIQNLLNTFDNPRRGLRAAKESIKAWRDPAVYSDWASGFNSKVAAEGRLTTDEWAGQYGLAQLGRAEDVASGILESIPGAGRVFQGADRAFATVSDVARAEWADDLLREELLQGKTIDSLRADGTLQQIANTVNAATGFVQGDFSLANLAMFSARFFTARILTMLRAIRGMDIDAPLDLIPVAGRKLQRDLPKVNKFSRTQDKYARRALMRMIGYGTLLTVALNELQGQDTDFRPVVNGKYNSNFLRFRAFNRDWSVFGPWDSLARMLVNVGNLRTKDTVRSLGNAPFVAMGMDLFENKDFLGRPLFNPKGSTPEQTAQITQYLAEGVLPFAASEAGELSGEAKDNLSEGDWLGLGLTGLFALSEGFGIKSSPLSTAELRALAENPSTSPEMRAEINQEIRERQQGFRRFDNKQSQGQSTADRIFGGN